MKFDNTIIQRVDQLLPSKPRQANNTHKIVANNTLILNKRKRLEKSDSSTRGSTQTDMDSSDDSDVFIDQWRNGGLFGVPEIGGEISLNELHSNSEPFPLDSLN